MGVGYKGTVRRKNDRKRWDNYRKIGEKEGDIICQRRVLLIEQI